MIRRWQGANCWVGRPYGPPIAFVLHTQTGGDSGTVSEFVASSAQFSAHYSATLEGALDCYVDVRDRAWANGVLEPGNAWSSVAAACGVDPSLNPNQVTVSCETEDDGDTSQTVTDSQFRAVLYAAWETKQRYQHSLRYLVRHADISPQSRANCPGDRWIRSGRFQALADAIGLKTVSS